MHDTHMYTLSILTLEKKIFIDSVYSTIVPGAAGSFEILSHHAPMIALTRSGNLEVHIRDEKKNVFAVSDGFLEVSRNKVTLFVDSAERLFPDENHQKNE